jgi:RNA binding exosome subunit
MNKLVRISATVASSLALVAGFSGAAGAASINDSGRNSDNEIKAVNVVKTDVDNDTHVSLHNDNDQHAYSGDANVRNNDDVDGVSTGDAMNDNSTDASVDVSSNTSTPSGGGGMGGAMDLSDASITDSGRDSSNEIKSINVVRTDVDNDTSVYVTNNNDQHASSGDANVKNNDDVGNVSTGDASNTNSSTFSVSVSNTTN